MARRDKTPLAAACVALTLAVALLPGAARADCTCRLAGASVPLGAVACLTLDGRPALYRCGMNLNLTSWIRTGDDCPEAGRDDGTRLAGLAPPSAHPARRRR